MRLTRRSLLAGTPALALARPVARAATSSSFHRGMNLAHLHRRGIGYGSAACEVQLRRLRDLGCTHVALTPFGYLPGRDAGTIVFGGSLDPTLTDDDLAAAAEQAHALGMAVLVKPHLWAHSFWSGRTGASDVTPDDWQAWFRSYGDFALHYARVAARARAEAYAVGVELTRASAANPGAWASVAARCRREYDGALLYCANWYGEPEAFSDWAAFDLIGIDAYPPLSDGADPTVDALMAGWRPHLARWEELAGRWRRPVVLAEAGLRAVRGAAARPWDQTIEGAADPALQARSVDALLRAATLWGGTWLAGVYWWKWFTDAEHAESDPYSLIGTPAEAAIARWWARH